jgi:hypothetical protein
MTFEFEQQLYQKQSILQIIKLKTFFIKEFWWEFFWNDVNWLSTFRKHSQFESCEFFLKIKFKINWTKLKNFKSFLPHVNGV